MRIDELGADEFMCAVAAIAENAQAIMDSDSGKALAAGFGEFRGSLADVAEADRQQAAGVGILKTVTACLPALLRENGDAVYGILAACDGQTVEEYKAEFSPAKMMRDIKELVGFVSSNTEAVTAFLA